MNPKLICTLAAAVLAALGAAATAAELPAGAVIEKDNLDRIKGDTFEGKTIGSMLPEKMEFLIRNHGMKMTLRKSEAVPKDPRWVEATKKYAGEVQFDPQTRRISGYKAGLAFPNVDPKDPHAAVKLMWNADKTGGYPRANLQDYPLFAFLFIDGDKGIERVQHWALIRYFMTGRVDGQPVLGDGSIHYNQLLFAHYPYDISGLGTFTVRYNDGRPDDISAYLKSVRRMRKLSGGAWADPIGGTDQLADEIEVMSAYPLWYPEYKLLGKRWMLAVAHSKAPPWNKDEADQQKAFPNVDLSSPPYWNPKDDWEPREVYAIEATMPPEHPYSRRVMYLDADTWVFYFGEAYDKKGDFWKASIFNMRPLRTEDGGWSLISNQGHTIDLKRRHATIFVHDKLSRFNTKGVGPDDVSLGVLEAAGRGSYIAK
jgi:Protein of unknown function (DUF1329)